MTTLGKVAIVLICIAVAYLLIALALVTVRKPVLATVETDEGMSFASAMAQDYSDLPDLQYFEAQDGAELAFRRYESAAETTRILILVHGSAWHGMQFHQMAKAIAGSGETEVIVPDMRGHGVRPLRRGDIDYMDQLEDDIAGLITHVKQGRTEVKLVLGGHSSGGGFVLRFAGGKHAALAQGFVFMSPFIRYDAPTTRQNAGGWAHPVIPRIIGLSMLNRVGITALNHLPVISFAMPRAVLEGPYGDTATTVYSYRMNLGFAPHANYEADMRAIGVPFLLLAGSADEAFVAEAYQPLFSEFTDAGTYEVLPGVDHIGLVSDGAAIEAIKRWMDATG
ncbi:MAG: alpha/beta hydrolase [Paracoccaceae bacterium]